MIVVVRRITEMTTETLMCKRLKISKMPAYKQVLKLGQEREGALLLDIGCCCTSGVLHHVSELHKARVSWQRCTQSCGRWLPGEADCRIGSEAR
jgi:hypothetical protein